MVKIFGIVIFFMYICIKWIFFHFDIIFIIKSRIANCSFRPGRGFSKVFNIPSTFKFKRLWKEKIIILKKNTMEKKDYQFVQVPINLFILLDNNCRSMLFTLIQLSTYYAEEDGWFFRTYADLEAESNLSKNLVEATIQTLFNHYLIEAKPTGQGKGKKANYYKVNFEEFTRYEEYSIEDCMKNPDLKIRTVEYKGSHFKLNLVREKVEEVVNNVVTKVVKSDNNINNIYNKNNIYNIENNNINKNNNILEEKENIINNIKEKEKY